MKQITTIFFLLIFSLSAFSQVRIKGEVVNDKGEPLNRVVVVLKSPDKENILSYSVTNEKGFYQLEYNVKQDSIVISISGVSVVPASKKIKAVSQTLNFKAEQRTIKLKEVVVRATKVWGKKDTINYLVSSFRDKGDFVIGDVLNKMPGIEIKESGEIYFNGKHISNFYIENLDMLKGRYGIATKNIKAQDVSTVQVLQNHQAVKSLDGKTPSGSTAINLKLKEASKGTLSVLAQLGGGYSPLIWENELCAMFFDKNVQHISTYKGNNSGINLSHELTSFNDSYYLYDGGNIRLRLPSPPDISEKYWLFNNTNAVTTNSLIKLSKDKQISVNAIYLNDHDNRDSYSNSTYFLTNDKMMTIVEDARTAQNNDRLETEVGYKNNTSSRYVSNDLKVTALWDGGVANINNMSNAVEQRLSSKSIKVANNFYLNTNVGNRNYSVASNNSFSSLPQTLTVVPNIYGGFINDDGLMTGIRQYYKLNRFSSDNRASLFSFMRNYLQISLVGKVRVESQNVNSTADRLYPHNIFRSADSLRNDFNRAKYDVSAQPSLIYMREKLKVEADLPVTYCYIYAYDVVRNSKSNYNNILFNPALYFEYKFGYMAQLNMSCHSHKDLGGVNEMLSGYIFKDYRTIDSFSGGLVKRRSNSADLSLSYKDVMNMLFGSLNLSYVNTHSDMLIGYRYLDNLTLSSLYNIPHCSNALYSSIKISKAFNTLSSTITLTLSDAATSGVQMVDAVKYNFRGRIDGAELSATAKFCSWLGANVNSSVQQIDNRVEGNYEYSKIKVASNKMCVKLFFPHDIVLKLNAEHYYNNIASSTSKNKFFADSELDYKIKKMQLVLCWTNIFNTDRFVTSTFGATNLYYYSYNIRPENILFKVKFNI